MRGVLRMAGLWALLAALLASGCARTPELRETGALAALAAQAPAMVGQGLAVPARLGLARLSAGRVTPVPATERARWAGALAEANRRLLYPLRLVALPPPARAGPSDAGAGRPGTEAAVDALLAAAARAGLDAVLLYEIATRVENDRLAASIAELPLVGGVIPRTTATEGHGTAIALLVDARSRAVIGFTTARMRDRVIAGIRHTGGRPAAGAAMADYAMVHVLAPRVEDMLVGAVTGGS